MDTSDAEKNKKRTKKTLKKASVAYLRQREKANARKKKFLDKMTDEQKEIKRAKDREYYKKKKAVREVKNIADMTGPEKRKQRKEWKKASKKYREKKKALANIISNTPPQSDAESAAIPSVRRQVGRKKVRKDRAKENTFEIKLEQEELVIKEELEEVMEVCNSFEIFKFEANASVLCDRDHAANTKIEEQSRTKR